MHNYLREHWWIFLLQGILLVLLGAGILAWPGITLVTTVLFLALFLAINGVIKVLVSLFSFNKKKGWYWSLFGGIVELAAGALILIFPGLTTISFIFLIGFVFIAKGIFEFAESGDEELMGSSRGITIFVGILDILIGIYLAMNPVSGGITLFWVLGAYAIFAGIMEFIKSITLKPKSAGHK